MDTLPDHVKLSVFNIPTPVEDSPFYAGYRDWVSCHDELIRSDLESLIFNKTLFQIEIIENKLIDFLKLGWKHTVFPFETKTPLDRLISACIHGDDTQDAFEWLRLMFHDLNNCSRHTAAALSARHDLWLYSNTGAVLVKTTSERGFPRQHYLRLKRIRFGFPERM